MEFVDIFSKMGWVSMILLIVGFAFFLIEIFVPGFGFFGITGIISAIAGIVVRIVEGLNLTQALTLILIVIGAFGVGTMFMITLAKYGIVGSSGLFENKSTLSSDYNKISKEYKKLIGKSGKTVSSLNLGGKAKINGKIYDVVARNKFIEQGANIKVVEIKDNQIVVRKWFE